MWPKKKWSSFNCKVCEKYVENNGTNMHVCFACTSYGFKLKNKHHLCGDHVQVGLGKLPEGHIRKVKWNKSGATISIGNKTKTKKLDAVSAVEPTVTTVDETRKEAATFQESDNPPSTSRAPFHQAPVAPSPPDPQYLEEPPPAYESDDDEEDQV